MREPCKWRLAYHVFFLNIWNCQHCNIYPNINWSFWKKKKKFGGALERAAKHLHSELNMWQNCPYVTSSPSYLKGEEVCLYIITKEILTALSFSTIESEGCVIPCTTYLLYATCTSPIMHLICPPPAKVHITVFHFPWVLKPSQENSKTMLMQNFVVANMVYYGGCASGV